MSRSTTSKSPPGFDTCTAFIFGMGCVLRSTEKTFFELEPRRAKVQGGLLPRARLGSRRTPYAFRWVRWAFQRWHQRWLPRCGTKLREDRSLRPGKRGRGHDETTRNVQRNHRSVGSDSAVDGADARGRPAGLLGHGSGFLAERDQDPEQIQGVHRY